MEEFGICLIACHLFVHTVIVFNESHPVEPFQLGMIMIYAGTVPKMILTDSIPYFVFATDIIGLSCVSF